MKQKITQHVLTLLLIVLLSLAGSSAQNFLPVGTLDKVNECSTVGNMYLTEDNDTDGIPDYFLYLRSNFRLFGETPPNYNAGQLFQFADPTDPNNTKVFYYASDTNVLTKKEVSTPTFAPLDDTTFKRASRVFPYNQWVRGIDTNNTKIIFERPLTTGASNIVSILYRYKYSWAVGYKSTNTSPYWYNSVASGSDFHGLNGAADYVDWTDHTRRWSPIATQEYCKNYTMNRCGDGTINTYDSTFINTFTGEVCDDGALNGTAGKCNLSCSGTGGAAASCGDSIIDPATEECDAGTLNGSDLCTISCSIPPQDAPVDEAVNE